MAVDWGQIAESVEKAYKTYSDKQAQDKAERARRLEEQNAKMQLERELDLQQRFVNYQANPQSALSLGTAFSQYQPILLVGAIALLAFAALRR